MGVLIGLFFIYKSISMVRKKEEEMFSLIIWLILGIALLISGLFPEIFNIIRKILGMKREAYAMFSLGLFLSYLLIFKIFSYIRDIKKDVSKLNQEISIQKHEKDQN